MKRHTGNLAAELEKLSIIVSYKTISKADKVLFFSVCLCFRTLFDFTTKHFKIHCCMSFPTDISCKCIFIENIFFMYCTFIIVFKSYIKRNFSLSNQ